MYKYHKLMIQLLLAVLHDCFVIFHKFVCRPHSYPDILYFKFKEIVRDTLGNVVKIAKSHAVISIFLVL